MWAAKVFLVFGLFSLITACGSSFKVPSPVDPGPLRGRAVSNGENNIRVSAAIPHLDESKSIFGVDMGRHGVQPLWLEIENASERRVVFLPTGLDPEYFAPLEVAFLFKDQLSDEGHTSLADHIQSLSLDSRRSISPGETVSGYVYLNQAEPTMIVNIDLIGQKWSQRIGLLVPVPGTEAAQKRIDALQQLYAAKDFVEIENEAMLRKALERLPCCTTSSTGTDQGPPLNLAFIGDLEALGPTFVRRGFRYKPVSAEYAFGRLQDFSGQKISRWIAPQPHTIRIWLAPLRYRGKPVWVGQVSTRLGGRFAAEPGDGTAPVIEPNLDEARNDLIQDMFYAQSLVKIGFVKAMDKVPASKPRKTTSGSSYHTDGLRAVLMFAGENIGLSGIKFFDWERLSDYRRQ
jgi:hypothetical protein